ncbi:MAG TPA: glucose-6-phosphate dehydrogenase assembly protein OpcA [Acidimicrobiales bacterium]|nr:glucose-6-phosphate dehydrogenase assembly protein OpcA [Acidimicrobiales bacterium]
MSAEPGGVGPRSTTIGSWEAENVSIGHVERALSDLRRHEQRAAVRASVLTLVAVTHSQSEADLVRSIIHDLDVRHPSRTLVVVLEKGEPDVAAGEGTGVDAAVWVHALEHDGRAVCFEEVRLHVRGPARYHLDSIVGPFALPDVPLVVWLPASLPSPGDPLLDVADRLVVDSRAADEGGGDVLARAATLARRLPVTDLSWIRMAPWRSLLAGLFEGSVNRPFLDGVDRVEVAGNRGPRQLLGGWLLRRLALTPARVELKRAGHVSVCIEATDPHGRRATFCVVRKGAERVLTSTVEIEDGPHLEQTLQMQERWPARFSSTRAGVSARRRSSHPPRSWRGPRLPATSTRSTPSRKGRLTDPSNSPASRLRHGAIRIHDRSVTGSRRASMAARASTSPPPSSAARLSTTRRSATSRSGSPGEGRLAGSHTTRGTSGRAKGPTMESRW